MDDEKIVLKPCPCCKEEKKIETHKSYGPGYFSMCHECGYKGLYGKSKKQAIKLWNDEKIEGR